MKIERGMDLYALARLMDAAATVQEAEEMRTLLVTHYLGRNTNDIPEPVWDWLMSSAIGRSNGEWPLRDQ